MSKREGRCIFDSTLNGKRILYDAEMDAIESDESIDLEKCDLNECKFVELKTKELRTYNLKYDELYFVRWWAQCYLANIKKIICGDRDKKGVVSNLQLVNVDDIPKKVSFFS